MRAVLMILLFVLAFFTTTAQPYIKEKSRHRFAQLNIGTDIRHFPNINTTGYSNTAGNLNRASLHLQTEGRLIVGGTHFWGHADFYVAIPLISVGNSGFRAGIETGAKVYPWRIEEGKIRPYAGISHLATSYKKDGGTTLSRNRLPISAGLTFHYKRQLFDLGLTYNYNNTYNYYFSPTLQLPVTTHPLGISVSYKRMIETTLPAEADWKNGRTKALTDTLAKLNRLNGLTVAIGPSTAFFTKASPHNEATPSIDNHKTSSMFLDAGIGYYLHRRDILVNVAFRRYSSSLTAYGHSQDLRRRSIALEAYKFIGDYHGFVPFAGPALSYESLEVTETTTSTAAVNVEKRGLHPGVIFGWDIRPNRLQSFYLRTNLRFFPSLKVTMPSRTDVRFDALEVNFIQLVLFPGRMF